MKLVLILDNNNNNNNNSNNNNDNDTFIDKNLYDNDSNDWASSISRAVFVQICISATVISTLVVLTYISVIINITITHILFGPA